MTHIPQSDGRRSRWLFALLALIAVAAVPAVRGDEPKKDAPKQAPGLTAEQKAENLESFDVVWRTIRDTHFDPKLGGLDWNAVRDELRPKVEKATTTAEARAAMTEALGRLHLTHFGIIPAEAVDTLDDPDHGSGETGIEVRIIDGRAVVSTVSAGSPAEKNGVKPGWVVEKIRGKSVGELLAKLEKAHAASDMLLARKARGVMARLDGPIGGTVDVIFLDAKDKEVSLSLPLTEPEGTPASFGNLGTFYVQLVSKRVEGTIAYVALNIFFDPVTVIQKFSQAIKASGDSDGLILDLRGNPGGIGAMSMGMGGFFIEKPNQKLGTMITRAGSLHFVLNPRNGAFKGPVAVLVDELSMSTSEIFAGGLKDLQRAKVFGVRTPGAALPSRVDILPNGDRFQYAFANYIAVGGKPLEGIGVVPDVEAPLTRAALLEGRDPALDAAVRWIRSQKTKP
jgi:carboxyl-terminal processing protease